MYMTFNTDDTQIVFNYTCVTDTPNFLTGANINNSLSDTIF
jgi:hypothetical protein